MAGRRYHSNTGIPEQLLDGDQTATGQGPSSKQEAQDLLQKGQASATQLAHLIGGLLQLWTWL